MRADALPKLLIGLGAGLTALALTAAIAAPPLAAASLTAAFAPAADGVAGQAATRPTAVTADGTAAGPAAAAVTPVTVAELEPALRAYNAYVAGKLATLSGQVAVIEADLTAGDPRAARQAWLSAMLTWEQIGEEPYGSFGDFGAEIAAGPQGFARGPQDPGFTGLHRLEYGLWHGQPASTLLPIASQLAQRVSALGSQLTRLSNDPATLPVRAHEILEDALRDHLTGELDQGSGASYAETLADAQGDQVVLGELANLISARDSDLLPLARQQLGKLRIALLATRVNGAWIAVNAVPLAQRQQVDAAIGAVLETLSLVPGLLETSAP